MGERGNPFGTPIDESLSSIKRALEEFHEVAQAKLAELEQPLKDGRNRRVDRSKAAILAATRELMEAGAFRPGMAEICRRARCSVRTGFTHYANVDAVLLAAIDDSATRDSILNQMLGDHAYNCSPEAERAIVRAAVLGRAEA